MAREEAEHVVLEHLVRGGAGEVEEGFELVREVVVGLHVQLLGRRKCESGGGSGEGGRRSCNLLRIGCSCV